MKQTSGKLLQKKTPKIGYLGEKYNVLTSSKTDQLKKANTQLQILGIESELSTMI